MACARCGYGDNPADANFCENCGAETGVAAPASLAIPQGDPTQASTEIATLEPVASTATVVDPSRTSAPQAETLPLVDTPAASSGWTCMCGETNDPSEEYCTACGDERIRAGVALGAGDRFGNYAILEQLTPGSFRVQPAEGAATPFATLMLGESAALHDLEAVVRLLDADPDMSAGDSPVVPTILEAGTDPAHGSYLILSCPEGNWTPLASAIKPSATVAAGWLLSLLHLAESAAAAGRLLILTPSDVFVDGKRVFVPAPNAHALPLRDAIIADPVLLAPELRAGRMEIDARPAAAFGAAATLRSVIGSGLGYPAAWHATVRALMADDPAARPALAAVVRMLTVAAQRFVSAHRSACVTDIGHHHPVNQDAGGVWTWQRWDGTPVTLAIVADGVSAGKHSEDASAIAVDLLHAAIDKHWHDRDFDVEKADQYMLEAGYVAHQRIAKLPADSYDEASASTLVAACVVGGVASGIWCGDSRAYGVTPEGTTQLTRDHSWVNLAVDSGKMTLAQAKADPRAHVIARWLGATDPPTADPGFDRFRCELAPGDRILVCSDGLYMYFEPPADSDQHLADLIQTHGTDVQTATEELVQIALDRGGFDNITAVMVLIQ